MFFIGRMFIYLCVIVSLVDVIFRCVSMGLTWSPLQWSTMYLNGRKNVIGKILAQLWLG